MKKMVYLRPGERDLYHIRRLEKHGVIYFVVREFADGALYEAKSLATGAICTLQSSFCVEAEDAVQEP